MPELTENNDFTLFLARQAFRPTNRWLHGDRPGVQAASPAKHDSLVVGLQREHVAVHDMQASMRILLLGRPAIPVSNFGRPMLFGTVQQLDLLFVGEWMRHRNCKGPQPRADFRNGHERTHVLKGRQVNNGERQTA